MPEPSSFPRPSRWWQSASLAILLVLFLLLPTWQSPRIQGDDSLVIWGRVLVFFLICVLLARIVRREVLNSAESDRKRSARLGLVSLLFFLLCLDMAFMLIPRSTIHGTYSTKNWFRWYWKPVNSIGYRDAEPDSSGPYLLFVGDSFTAGQGIDDVRDRYSDIVGRSLPGYHAVNIGRPGADTRSEYKNYQGFLNRFGKKPATLVLQFYENDIIGIASETPSIRKPSNDSLVRGLAGRGPVTRFLVRGSYLANFVYWSIPWETGYDHLAYVRAAYDHPDAYPKLLSWLQRFADDSRRDSIELIVVVFPIMTHPEESRQLYTERIHSFFREQGVRTVDVASLCAGLPLRSRVVNTNDQHASVEVNRRVAEELLRMMGQGREPIHTIQ